MKILGLVLVLLGFALLILRDVIHAPMWFVFVGLAPLIGGFVVIAVAGAWERRNEPVKQSTGATRAVYFYQRVIVPIASAVIGACGLAFVTPWALSTGNAVAWSIPILSGILLVGGLVGLFLMRHYFVQRDGHWY
jgi:hypothetical protein